MKTACIVHDQVNLLLLPVLGATTIAGLTGHVAPEIVTHFFLAYILIDMLWVFLVPEAVPSLPNIILFHHAVTACLLIVPLRYPHLHYYTCVDGVVELNTFFLIARRQWRGMRRFFSIAYWATFVPLRLGLYPALVPVFLSEMRKAEAAWWETLACVGSQVILTGFNIVLLALSVMNRRKRRHVPANAKTEGSVKHAPLAGHAAADAAAGSEAAALQVKAGGAGAAGRLSLRVRAT